MFFDDRKLFCRGLLAIIAIGIIVRIILGYFLEYNNDVTAWTMTIANIDGGNGLYGVAGYYYPPVWGYMLASFNEIIHLIGIGSLGDYFTDIIFMDEIKEEAITSTPAFNLAFSMFLAVADILVSFVIYWLIHHFTGDAVKGKIGFTLYFLGANVVIISAVGGMFDTFSALLTLLCICFLIRGNDFMAGVLFSLAALLKLFPAFLIFLLVAYLFKKDRENFRRRLCFAILGAGLTTLVIMIPQIVDGTVMDSLSFVTSRATGANSEDIGSILMKYSSVIIYPIIVVLLILTSITFVRIRTEDVDRCFMYFAMFSMVLVFLYPGTPQYLILLMPFLIICALLHDEQLFKPMILLVIGSSVFALANISSDLISIVLYQEWLSYEAWESFYNVMHHWRDGILYDAWNLAGGILQYLATVWAGALFIQRLRKRKEAAVDSGIEETEG